MKRSLSFRTIIISLVGLIVFLVVADVTLSKFALRKLRSALDEAGITVRSLDVDLITRSVALKGFEWRTEAKSDSLSDGNRQKAFSKIEVNIETIRASWIDILSFVRNKEVNIGSFILSDGRVVAHRTPTNNIKQDSSISSTSNRENQRRLPFNHLSIGTFSIKNIDLIIRQDTITEHRAN